MPSAGPLAGLRVVDLTAFQNGPSATVQMADNGADVVKVEPAAGDGMRFLSAPGEINNGFDVFNRGKRSVCVDLKHEDAVEHLAGCRHSFPQKPVFQWSDRRQMWRCRDGACRRCGGPAGQFDPPPQADDLIAAWFVGQGFALQTIIKDIIAGIVARYNQQVRTVLVEGKGKVKYKEEDYTPVGVNIATITLQGTTNGIRVLPWSALSEMDLSA